MPATITVVNNQTIISVGENTAEAARQALIALGHATDAETAADSLNDRLQALPEDGVHALAFGAPGTPKVAGFQYSGVLELIYGLMNFALAKADGTVMVKIEVHDDASEWVFSASDTNTAALFFGLHRWDGFWSYEGKLGEGDTSTALAAPLPATENTQYLRQFISGCQTLSENDTCLVHVMLDGDSWLDTHFYGSGQFIDQFFDETGFDDAGPGWIGVSAAAQGGTPHGTARDNVTVTRDANWTDLFPSTSVSPGTPQNFPGYAACEATANNATITLTGAVLATCTSITLYCGKGGGVEQSWNAGANWDAVTVTAGSGSTVATIDLTGQSSELRIRCSDGTVVAGFMAIVGTSGVVFSNFASSGSTAEQHAAVQENADYQAMLATLPGDTFTAMLQLALNDAKSSSVSAENSAEWIGEVRDGYRAALPGCDVLYSCQPDTDLNTGFHMHSLTALLRVDARANECGLLDQQLAAFGPVRAGTTYAGYAFGSDVPLLGPDNRHPSVEAQTGNVNGARTMARAFSSVFTRLAKGF